MTEKRKEIEEFIVHIIKEISHSYDVTPPNVVFFDTLSGGVDSWGNPIMGEYVCDTYTINIYRPALEHRKTFDWYETALHEYRHFLQDMVIVSITGMARYEIFQWRKHLFEPSVIIKLDENDQSFIFRRIKYMDDMLEEDAEAWANKMTIAFYKQQYPDADVELPEYPMTFRPIIDIVSPVWDEISKIKEKVDKVVYHPDWWSNEK